MIAKKPINFLTLIASVFSIALACEASQRSTPPAPQAGCGYCASPNCKMSCVQCCEKWKNDQTGKDKCLKHCKDAKKL